MIHTSNFLLLLFYSSFLSPSFFFYHVPKCFICVMMEHGWHRFLRCIISISLNKVTKKYRLQIVTPIFTSKSFSLGYHRSPLFILFFCLLMLPKNFEQLVNVSVIAALVTYIIVCVCTYKIFSDNNRIKLIAGMGILLTFYCFSLFYLFTVLLVGNMKQLKYAYRFYINFGLSSLNI